MRKELLGNLAGIFLLYLIIVLGVVAVNARLGNVEEENSVVLLQKWYQISDIFFI